MTTLMEQEKQRISQRLTRLDAEREKLSGELDELEIAGRVLARFRRKAVTTEKRSRARPAKTTPGAAAKGAISGRTGRVPTRARVMGGKEALNLRGQSDQKAPHISISDASLKAVQAHREGVTPAELLNYLLREFGMTVRPNHLGAALQRHRHAGQLENRDQRWYLPS